MHIQITQFRFYKIIKESLEKQGHIWEFGNGHGLVKNYRSIPLRA